MRLSVSSSIAGIALAGLVGCRGRGQEQSSASPPPPAPAPPAIEAPRATTNAPLDAVPSADAAAPPPAPPPRALLPALSGVRTLELVSRQGGPSHPKCSGMISELSIDVFLSRVLAITR